MKDGLMNEMDPSSKKNKRHQGRIAVREMMDGGSGNLMWSLGK